MCSALKVWFKSVGRSNMSAAPSDPRRSRTGEIVPLCFYCGLALDGPDPAAVNNVWRAHGGRLVQLCEICGRLDSIRALLSASNLGPDQRAAALLQLEEVEAFLHRCLDHRNDPPPP